MPDGSVTDPRRRRTRNERNTLKKEGRVFRNIGKNISLYCVISLANFRLLFNLLLIRSSTARGSGTSILSRWSLQKLTSKDTRNTRDGSTCAEHSS